MPILSKKESSKIQAAEQLSTTRTKVVRRGRRVGGHRGAVEQPEPWLTTLVQNMVLWGTFLSVISQCTKISLIGSPCCCWFCYQLVEVGDSTATEELFQPVLHPTVDKEVPCS